MRTLFLALLAISLSAGDLRAQAQATPEEMLAKAVSLTKMCSYTSQKFEYGENGSRRLVGQDGKDGEAVKKISLPVLFRPGRFELSFGPDQMTKQNVLARVIHYSPLPEDRQLKALKGEDKDNHRVMNHMMGEVFIDPATGGIIRAKGDLKNNLEWKAKKIKVFELKVASFLIEQYLVKDEWLPWSFFFNLTYSRVALNWDLWGTFSYSYQAQFHCK